MKKSPLRKRRPYRLKTPYEKARHDAWRTFSLWVRNRDKKCITCGRTENLQAGHFRHNCLDFDEQNVNAQCRVCNGDLYGNPKSYKLALIAKYGEQVIGEIDRRRGKMYSHEELLEIIEKYGNETI